MNLKILVLSIIQFSYAIASISTYIPRDSNLRNDYKIKVRIAQGLSNVTVSGTDLTRFLHPVKQEKTYAGRKKVKFNCHYFSKDNSRLRNQVLLASLKSGTGLVTFDKKKYQGEIHVVTSKGKSSSCDVVNELDMDSYISSLLSKEMNASWPIEALKAQAIAARTYAIHKIQTAKILGNGFYDLENSEKHQVNGDFFDVTRRTLKAARETSGFVLKNKKGKLTPAFFHASCGGKTLRPHDVWANKVVGYEKVANCNYCKKKKNWQNSLTRKRLKKLISWAMKKKYIKPVDLKKRMLIYKDKKTRKVLHIKVGKKKIKLKKSLFRRYFGRVEFPSNNFYLADGIAKGPVHFVGKGNGHGVGLCQVGSKGLAHKGWDYKRILSHYFPELKIRKIY
jgi:stage II sporulation protein D